MAVPEPHKTKRDQEWDIFWDRYNRRYPFAKQMQGAFLGELEASFKDIATDIGMELDTNFTIFPDGRIKATQLGWLFLGKIFEVANRVSQITMEQKYSSGIAALSDIANQLSKIQEELKGKIKDVDELKSKIEGILDAYDQFDALRKSWTPPNPSPHKSQDSQG